MATLTVKRRLIELLRQALGFDDEAWAGVLERAVGCRRTAELDGPQVEKVLIGIGKRAADLGLLKRCTSLDGRPEFADGLQVGLIEFLWNSMHPGQGAKRQMRGLREVLQKTAGLSDLRFLSGKAADWLIANLAEKMNAANGGALQRRQRSKPAS